MIAKKVKYFIASVLSTFGTVCMISVPLENISIILYGLLFLLFLFFYKHEYGVKTVETFGCAVLFTIFIILGKGWYNEVWYAEKLENVLRFLAAAAGILIAFDHMIAALFHFVNLQEQEIRKDALTDSHKGRMLYFLSFSVLWVIYFIFFLNQYPGSLSCDTPSQLAQALGVEEFSNANPLVNTLIVTLCVRLGMLLFGNVNTGVALYTLAQFTLAAAVYAYVITCIYKKGYHIGFVLFAFLFFGFVPFNVNYAIGMWKDTFFSVIFLLTITFLWDILEKEDVRALQKCLLLVLAFVCSLARNSGWSALGCTGVLLFFYGKNLNKVVYAFLGGVAASLITILIVFPLVGISNGGVISTLSVPLQQVGRVVAEGYWLDDDERFLLDSVLDVDQVPEIYDEEISDPMKWNFRTEVMQQQPMKYMKLWLKIGYRNPMCYLDAYIALTRNYWFPDTGGWTVDNRIFENEFGVTRNRLLLKESSMADWYNSSWNFTKADVIWQSATYLWIAILCFAFSLYRKNSIGAIIVCSTLAIVIGLMFTSPVALFRYTYALIIATPVTLCLPFTRIPFELKTKKVMYDGEKNHGI